MGVEKLCLLFSVVLLIPAGVFNEILNSNAARKPSYGELCDETNKCDRRAWLSCKNGLCNCTDSEEMVYESEKGKCVSKPGERCKHGAYGSEEDDDRFVVVSECVSNSECGRSGVCVCKRKYHEISNGTCVLSKSLGETCSPNGDLEKCSKSEKLICIEGICNCTQGSSVYSNVQNQCVGVLNQNCVHGKCVEGAACNDEDGICSCDAFHFEDVSSGSCILKKSATENCTEDSECIQTANLMLKCINGKCACKPGLKFSKVRKTDFLLSSPYENVDPERRTIVSRMSKTYKEVCAPLIGGRCPSGYCPENAKCVLPDMFKSGPFITQSDENVSYESATCECELGFTKDKDGSKCGKNINGTCSVNLDCIQEFVCREGLCQCPSPSFQKFDLAKGACVTEVDGRCDIGSTCVANAFCELMPNSTVGHCQCREGFVDNAFRACELSYGASCSYKSNLCDQSADLICSDGKCSCKDSMHTYSEGRRRCVGLVGAKCSHFSDGVACGQNASCTSKEFNTRRHYSSNTKYYCKCNPGFKENSNFECAPIE